MAQSVIQQTCIGRTCLKWSVDGSLSEHDHDELMKRLCSSDPELAKSDACNFPKPLGESRRAGDLSPRAHG